MLSLLPVARPVLDYQELCGYSLELRKLMLGIPSMSAADLLKAFNAVFCCCRRSIALSLEVYETGYHSMVRGGAEVPSGSRIDLQHQWYGKGPNQAAGPKWVIVVNNET